MTAAKDAAVRRALETAGIEFIDENGGDPGVRLRKLSGLNSPNKQSLDDGLLPVLKRQIVTENSLGLEIRIRVSPLTDDTALHSRRLRYPGSAQGAGG